MASVGRTIFLLGLVLVAIGLVVWGASSVPMLSRLGRLPGDIYIRRGNFTFYFPITTAILVSIVVSVIFALLRR
ncbi:MAG TPA: DUF2905 domain-containing protein [Candidatus Binataceae bacterium]|nr:DUF2905 domain-containing protein [Candidatus Binataceae bacterium]